MLCGPNRLFIGKQAYDEKREKKTKEKAWSGVGTGAGAWESVHVSVESHLCPIEW